MKFGSVNEVLEFAISREQESADFYTRMAQRVEHAQSRKLFEGFAQEELGHKAKLQNIRNSKVLLPAQKQIQDMKIAEYVADVEVTEDLGYQDALIIAMKKEKMAFKLYNDLAASTDDPDLQTTFRILAQEEAKHKLRFELEYDDYILTDN